MSFFIANNICAGYGSARVLSGVSFSIDRGSITGVIGANGSGKTTLLKAICGILSHEGSCMLNGVSLEGLSPRQIARHVSYIPQRSGVTIDISALDVVLMGFNPQLGLLDRPTRGMREKALGALEQVGLAGRENVNFQHLSEGQKQLCILARTLVSDCCLLLLDEPESALDFRFRYNMLALLRRMTAEQDAGAIVTLHDPTLALNACDQLVLLCDGGVLDTIRPQTDPLTSMEQSLSRIYGPVSLQWTQRKNGSPQLIMLKEDV